MKPCSKCKMEKDRSKFWRDSSCEDGLCRQCKSCMKKYQQSDDCKKANQKYKENNPNRIAKTRQISDRKYRQNHPEKKKARNKISHAPRDGTIKRPSQCESCFEEGPVEGHHEDYSKQLEVIWLCKGCHMKRHREIEMGVLVC
ncbi:hypothetical protein LCGC14_2330250 [marine sediment metagenome]|uniref:Uncharacterized protein n=1 Tax=marine sediment metagenome TaxID=412755 RepID=A0A0F9ESR8_9ZZZZ